MNNGNSTEWVTKSMKLNKLTATTREEIKKIERFTDNELEEYFILAVLQLRKNGVAWRREKAVELENAYGSLIKMYDSKR